MSRSKFYLTIFFIYQIFSTALIAVGIWPQSIVYLNLAISLAAILFFDIEYALYSVILTVPFYLAVPNPKYDSLSAWRFAFAFLFLVFYVRHRKEGQKLQWFAWDKYGFWFVLTIILSILFEQFKSAGIKKLVFILNAYLIYIVVLNLIKSKQQIKSLIAVTFASLCSIVLVGYVQFASTFTTSTYYFWQYWAVTISKAYYGLTLANTLTYSNSWFSFFKGQPPALRMFSILPDSHSFGVISMFSIPFAAALILFAQKRWQKILLWIFIALATLSITLSGTRGVWAAIIAPVILAAWLYYKHYGRKLLAKMFVPLVLVLVFLAASPLIQKAFSASKGHNYGNFLERAQSIYDLSDQSNAGRIAIWKNTLKYVSQHPELGAGFGNFVVSLDPNETGSFQQIESENVQQFNLPKRYITAHNFYLDVLAETGVIGFIFFMLYLKEVFVAFWRFFKKYYLFAEDPYVFFAVNAGLYLVWLFAYSLVDGTILNDRVLIYFFIALAVSANIIRAHSQT